MFCPSCQAEYRDGFTECSDCRIQLVTSLERTHTIPGPLAEDDPRLLRKQDEESHYLALGAVGAMCLIVGLGRLLDWKDSHLSADRNMGSGFLAAYAVLAVVSRDRFSFVLYSLITVVAWGVLGTIARQSLDGLLLIAPCFVAACIMFWWKHHSPGKRQ
jgi:hypothetical protein